VMPIRTVGEYLKRWGYTPQKPVKPAYEQSTQVVQKWLERDYPVTFRSWQDDWCFRGLDEKLEEKRNHAERKEFENAEEKIS
jgi:hypothetical protein